MKSIVMYSIYSIFCYIFIKENFLFKC